MDTGRDKIKFAQIHLGAKEVGNGIMEGVIFQLGLKRR